MSQRKVCLGVITGPHGVRGVVRVKSFTEAPADVAAYGPLSDEEGRRRFALSVVGEAKGVLLTRVAGVEDREAAAALRGTRLFVDRDALPAPEAGEFYHADLIGVAVVTADGAPFGEVAAVENFGAGDVVEIARTGGAREMLPFTAEVFPEVDLAGGRVVVVPPEDVMASPEAADPGDADEGVHAEDAA